MPKPAAILFDPECPVASAAARVLAALGVAPTRPVTEWFKAPERSVLLLATPMRGERLPLLALRQEGFRGGVVVLSGLELVDVVKQHGVLNYGLSIPHTVWTMKRREKLGLSLVDLLAAVQGAKPITEDQRERLLRELTIPKNFLEAEVEPCLARLRKYEDASVPELEALIDRTRRLSTRAAHFPAAIAGRGKKPLGFHLDELLEEVKICTENLDAAVDALGEAFRLWHRMATNL